ncbi:Y-family DNA polymerase [Acidocella facilis]|uniref:Y-family DNA polymerase n=1 Tax=Acidocella facilis TaxID=525 RepID=UPI001F41BBDF|nr:DNA polymerase Y family protein [Acidocella facilis]
MQKRRFLSLACAGPDDLAALALWCQAFTPLTAPDPPDGVMLDIAGCAHLFGGEAGLMARLAARLPNARMAVADTAAAAWGLARYGKPGSPDILLLPLAALRLAPEPIARLRRIGIRTIGQLARLPRTGLVAGYGPAPALRLAQALGEAPEVIRFITAPPEWREAEPFMEPLWLPAQLQAALTKLAARLCARLTAATLGATALTARFYRVDRACPAIHLAFAAPCRDEAQIAKLLIEKLAQEIDPGFGIEAVALEAPLTEPLALVQQDMGAKPPDYARPLNTLLNRLGSTRIWRVAPHASHIPEFATERVTVKAQPVAWPKPHHPRPLRLLNPPVLITAIAPVPDDPPVQFTWDGKTHRLRWATGPERIARDWWAHPHDPTRPEAEKIRDYYQVEDMEAARFWLFRAGLHEGVAAPRWYLHGLFA